MCIDGHLRKCQPVFRGIIEFLRTDSTIVEWGPAYSHPASPSVAKHKPYVSSIEGLQPASQEWLPSICQRRAPHVAYSSPTTSLKTSCSRTLPSRHGTRQSPTRCLCSRNPTMSLTNHHTRCVRSHSRAWTGLVPERRSD